MAKDKFQLNKGADRGFDISKGGKRKFDLKKDDDEVLASTPTMPIGKPTEPTVKPAAAPTPTAPLSGEAATVPIDSLPEAPEKKNSKKWLAIAAVAAILIALAAWWLWPSSSKTEAVAQEEPAQQAIAQDNEPQPDVTETETTDVTEATDVAEAETAKEEPVVEEPVQVHAPTQTQTQPAHTPANVTGDIITEAYNVIRGDYGVGQERKDKLGARYAEIQAKVNELMRSL